MVRKTLGALALIAAVAGCAQQHRVSHAPAPQPPRQTAAAQPAPPAPARPAAEALADPSEAVWHLRAGLNVAALSCRGRGRVSVAPGYSRLLARHRALLAAAYSGEQRRYGGGLDRHLTRIYNRFAMQRSPERFCQSAAQVAEQANGMDSAGLSRAAPGLLSRLD